MTPRLNIVLVLFFPLIFTPIEFLQFSILEYASVVHICTAINEKEVIFSIGNSAVMNCQMLWKNNHYNRHGSNRRIAKASGRTGKCRA